MCVGVGVGVREREVYTSQSTSCAEEKNMAFERRVLLILLLLVGVSSNFKKKKSSNASDRLGLPRTRTTGLTSSSCLFLRLRDKQS